MHPTKKVLFVDSYGVKSSHYRGRRNIFSSIRQILGSSTDRHNDLFGMAIFQFEREYAACLERRKQNEPHILNILFPIKTGKNYLEYLENTQSQQTGKKKCYYLKSTISNKLMKLHRTYLLVCYIWKQSILVFI